jgi:hypothetical protein
VNYRWLFPSRNGSRKTPEVAPSGRRHLAAGCALWQREPAGIAKRCASAATAPPARRHTGGASAKLRRAADAGGHGAFQLGAIGRLAPGLAAGIARRNARYGNPTPPASRIRKGSPSMKSTKINYAQLSWYVHSGIVGVANLGATTFALLAGLAFNIAMESYMEILTAIIDEFKIIKADPKLKDKMMLAKLLPFTDTPQEASRLQRAFLGT